jgi:hypothetical protein
MTSIGMCQSACLGAGGVIEKSGWNSPRHVHLLQRKTTKLGKCVTKSIFRRVAPAMSLSCDFTCTDRRDAVARFVELQVHGLLSYTCTVC